MTDGLLFIIAVIQISLIPGEFRLLRGAMWILLALIVVAGLVAQ